MPESPYPELPYDDALAAVLAAVMPLNPVTVAFDAAHGLILAEPVHAVEPMPPFAASAKDGYAVTTADTDPARLVLGDLTAGRTPDVEVRAGTAARITTGAPLPAGADAVVMVEDVDELVKGSAQSPDGSTAAMLGDRRIQIRRLPSAGENVRPVGEDYPAGQRVLGMGSLLGAADVGLLASVGATQVHVFPRPRVAILSSGDELVEPGTRLAPGQIRDSNRFALAAAAREAGADVVYVGTLRDSTTDLAVLPSVLAAADVVVTSGGVSMGQLDLVKPWLAQAGRILFGRVRIKPGKPMTFAMADGTPVFALPGFPVSSMVCFELFVRPALLRLAGRADTARPIWSVRAGHPITHAVERTEFQRAIVTLRPDGTPVARTTGFQGSGRLLSLSGANALLRLPEGIGMTPEGASVSALMLGLPQPERDDAVG